MTFLGVRTPANEYFTAVTCWVAIGLLWLLVNRTRAGKAVLAASMNPRGVTPARLRAVQHLSRRLGAVRAARRHGGRAARHVPRRQLLQRRAADRERLLDRRAGGLGSVSGSLIAAYVVGYLETDHRLSDLAGIPHHPGPAAAGRRDVYAAARPVRAAVTAMRGTFTSRLFWIAAVAIVAGSVPAALGLGLCAGPADRGLLHGGLRHVLGPAVRLCRRGQFRGRPS